VSAFPLRYAHANILFGRGDERAALFSLETISYPFRTDRDKIAELKRLAQFAFAIEADFSLWRVCRAYPAERYLEQAAGLLDERHQSRARWTDYLTGHEHHLAALESYVPEVYVAISLRAGAPSRLGGNLLRSWDRTRRRLEDLLGVGAPQPVGSGELDALIAAEERAFARLAAAFGARARRASTSELQWLARRAACRGIGEPRLDPHWEPNALLVENPDGQVVYEPVETDLVRLANAPLLEEPRALISDAEEGRSFQAMLALGSLPDDMDFPGGAELLCTPLEGAGFPVDAVLHAKWIGNREAIGQVRKRIMDADNVYAEELRSDSGPLSFAAEENRHLARELDQYLQDQARPPLLRCAISLALGAPSRAELERRVETLQSLYGTVQLHRPLGLQPRLFFDHLPRAGGAGVGDYAEVLTIEQFGALMPLGTLHVGAEQGIYIGETTAGTRRPVKFDVTEAPREGRPPSILMAGTLGSGKTIAAELLAYGAERRGSLIVDVDPKPDHALDQLPELEGRVRVVELSGAEQYRGMLDPLRIGLTDLREELCASYLTELLPQIGGDGQTAIRRAVRQAIDQGASSTRRVLELLAAEEDQRARDVGRDLTTWADSGLGRLAFCDPESPEELHADRPITTIRAHNLNLPGAEDHPDTYDADERLAVATLKLVAAYAMRLISQDRSVHTLALFDEAWVLTNSRAGRRLLDRLNRLGRSMNATLILATQSLGDVGELENLIGTRFIFGQETPAEAQRALRLLGLDPEDRALVERIRSFRKGRCLMRDINDRIAEVQIDPVDPAFLRALDTSPTRPEAVPA